MNLSASINYLWIKSIGIGLSQVLKVFGWKGGVPKQRNSLRQQFLDPAQPLATSSPLR